MTNVARSPFDVIRKEGAKMFRKATQVTAAAVLALVVAGCSSNWKSIFRTADLDSGTSLITDAKQRVVINVPASGDIGQNKPQRIVCAEPSPDVAQAVSDAISAALEVEVAGKGGGAFSFGRSTAEAVAQLGERLGTIQLLRDGFYRACEAYANGAINATTYSMIVSRIDDTMVTLLMSEMAAGAFGRAGAAIGTAATGGAGPGAHDIDPEMAKEKVEEAQDEVKELEGKITRLKTDINDPDKAVAKAANEEKLKEARKELADAERDLKYQQAFLAVVRAGSIVTAARTVLATGVGGISGDRGVASATQLENMHRRFLEFGERDLSPLITACITTLDSRDWPPNAAALGELESALMNLNAARDKYRKALEGEKETVQTELDEAFGRLQQAVATTGMTGLGFYCAATVLPEIMKRVADMPTSEEREGIEKKAISEFCSKYLATKGEQADKDTLIACIEALTERKNSEPVPSA